MFDAAKAFGKGYFNIVDRVVVFPIAWSEAVARSAGGSYPDLQS